MCRRICLSKIQKVIKIKESTVKFWAAVRKLTDARGDLCYKELADFALRAFSLPVSNAVVERVFSVMGIVKDKLRNRMSFLLLVAILRFRIHLKVIKKCCKNYSASKKMLELFTSDMYKYENLNSSSPPVENSDVPALMEALNLVEMDEHFG